MIPKRLHYCWFGGKPLPLQAKRCLASWAYRLPGYELVRWDETNFDPASHPFAAAAWKARAWAFVADYVRMLALFRHGGIYLDVDVEVLASLDPLADGDFFIGLEDRQRFASAVIGARAGHWLPQRMLEFYDRTPFDAGCLKQLVNVNEISRLLLAHGFSGEGGDETRGSERVLAIGRLAAADPALYNQQTLTRHLYAASWKCRGGKDAFSRCWRYSKKLPAQAAALVAWQGYRMRAWLKKI